tara:strand:+ start:1454 stop:1630 length:177 start_codon:yes stop_codon:yes gene_type:complete
MNVLTQITENAQRPIYLLNQSSNIHREEGASGYDWFRINLELRKVGFLGPFISIQVNY